MNFSSASIKVMVKRATTIVEDEESKMDIDDSADSRLGAAVQASPATSEADEAASVMVHEFPAPFKLAVQLTFGVLLHVPRNPMWKASPFARSTLNPYKTIVLMFPVLL
jgi:protein SMG6